MSDWSMKFFGTGDGARQERQTPGEGARPSNARAVGARPSLAPAPGPPSPVARLQEAGPRA